MSQFSRDSAPNEKPARTPRSRVHAIDAVRGIAVVAMIEWHTADAWLVPGVRDGTAFATTRLIGGLAAPSFLFLAGLSLALAAPERLDARWLAGSARRASRIVLMGYALNLWSWSVDRTAVLAPTNLLVAVSAGLALLLLATATRDAPLAPRARAGLALGALAPLALVIALLDRTTHDGPSLLPRLDVLHGIGAALVATALALFALRSTRERARIAVLAGTAIAISCASVVMIGAPQRVLPLPIADWIARGAPWPAPTTSGFPLFPWLAYALAGASVARWMRGASPEHRWALPRIARPALLLAIALAIAATTWEPSPLAAAVLARAGALRSLFRLAFNTSLIAAAGACVALAGGARGRVRELFAWLGRSSLLVYCVHLEFAFGLVGGPLRRALGWGGWALGLVGLVLAMTALAWAAEKLEERARDRAKAAVHTAA